jgi:hypothetical protein
MTESYSIEIPLVLRGAALHTELNREYENGYRDGVRAAFFTPFIALVIVGLLGFAAVKLIGAL